MAENVVIMEKIQNPKARQWEMLIAKLDNGIAQVSIIGAMGGLKARFWVDRKELKQKVAELDD
jgi:hypothetical protein